MTTDYLGDLFPPYVLTEDTTVVRCKRYFRKEGSGYSPVLDGLSSDNPKTKGWYEFKSNHNKEYKFHTESLQMNNVADVCNLMLVQLREYPVWTLPRSTETKVDVGGTLTTIKLDWRGSFADSKWNEVIGALLVPQYGVTFATNLYYAENINKFVTAYADFNASHKTAEDVQVIIELVTGFVSAIQPLTGLRYLGNGYTFDPTTLGSEARAKDVYTLASYWSRIEFRMIVSVLQDGLKLCESLSGSESIIAALNLMLSTFRNCARTMVDLAMRTVSYDVRPKMKMNDASQSVSTSDHRTFISKIVTVPGTIVVDGTTYYRLNSKAQLVDGKIYGVLQYNNDGSVTIFNPQVVEHPSTQFVTLGLPDYKPELITEEIDIPVSMVLSKKIWFTNVPFTGA